MGGMKRCEKAGKSRAMRARILRRDLLDRLPEASGIRDLIYMYGDSW